MHIRNVTSLCAPIRIEQILNEPSPIQTSEESTEEKKRITEISVVKLRTCVDLITHSKKLIEKIHFLGL